MAYPPWDMMQYSQRQVCANSVSMVSLFGFIHVIFAAKVQTPSQPIYNRHPHIVTYPRQQNPGVFSGSPQASVLSDSPFTSSASSSLSSQTCSPWETCPGLAPVSPQVLAGTIASLRQAQGLIGPSNGDMSGNQASQSRGQYFQQNRGRKRSMDELIADVGLSLDTSIGLGLSLGTNPESFFQSDMKSVPVRSFDQGISFDKMTLQSPIQLTFENHSPQDAQASAMQIDPVVSLNGGGPEFFTESASSPVCDVSMMQSSTVIAVPQTANSTAVGMLLPNRQFASSSPLTPVDDKRENVLPLVSSSTPGSPRRHTSAVNSHLHSANVGVEHPHCQSTLDDASLYTRAARRKVSKVNYAVDAFDSSSDGDFEYDEEYEGDDDTDDVMRKGPKRGFRSISTHVVDSPRKVSGKKIRRVRSEGNAQAYGGDSDDDFISLLGENPSTLDDASSSSSPSKSINSHPSSRSRSKSKPKPKSKRRHHCPRPNCHATFTRITDMERHLGSVHRAREGGTVDEACRCSFCGKVFSREDAVLRHENDSCPVRVKKRKW